MIPLRIGVTIIKCHSFYLGIHDGKCLVRIDWLKFCKVLNVFAEKCYGRKCLENFNTHTETVKKNCPLFSFWYF